MGDEQLRRQGPWRWLRRALGCFTLAAAVSGALAACTGGPPATRRDPAAAPALADPVVAAAHAMVGRPYRYGGASPEGFDCSGLVAYAHEQAGIDAPRTVAGQLRAAARLPRSALEAGDLVFFELDDKPAHVGIYAGEGRFIHAPSSGGYVRYTELDRAYWRRRFLAGGRL